MTHTPGKWTNSIWGATPVFSGFHTGCYVQKGNDELIAFVTAKDEETGKANARLIAAAPEMYETLKEIMNRTWGSSDPEEKAICELARKVIREARGQS